MVITEVEGARRLIDIRNLKKLKGGDNHVRIRVGEYRIGLVLVNETVIFVRCLHRSDIYRFFR